MAVPWITHDNTGDICAWPLCDQSVSVGITGAPSKTKPSAQLSTAASEPGGAPGGLDGLEDLRHPAALQGILSPLPI